MMLPLPFQIAKLLSEMKIQECYYLIHNQTLPAQYLPVCMCHCHQVEPWQLHTLMQALSFLLEKVQ